MAGKAACDGIPDMSNMLYSTAISDLATDRPSSLASASDAALALTSLIDFSTSLWRPPRNVKDFIAALVSLKVEGPLTLVERLEERFKLGEGGQFVVYSNKLLDDTDCSTATNLENVAVKKCLTFQDVSASKTVDLLSPQYQTQVHDMLLEVAALRDARLNCHRNIVELIGYGVEMDAWHQTPFLVMSLAIGDLSHFLSIQRTWDVLQQLCLDVGCGLDLIHHCGLVHGDLKPLNILVFEDPHQGAYVAKLADFGFSIGELDTHNEGLVNLPGCSHGWAAPEVELHFELETKITVKELMAADNYAYGLLVVSTLCYNGKILPRDQSGSLKDLGTLTSRLPSALGMILTRAIDELLKVDYAMRPPHVGHLLKDDSEACRKWLEACRESELDWRPPSDRSFYDWELPSLAPFLVQGLEQSFHSSKAELTGPQLLAMYLLKSFKDAPKADKSVQIEMLIEACRKDFPPAQAIVARVLRSYDLTVTEYLSSEEAELWMSNAVATGSMFAYHELKPINSSLASQARDQFRDMAGYNQWYSPLFEASPEGVQTLGLGNQAIHRYAAYGNLNALMALLDTEPKSPNSLNELGETALYKACLAGHHRVVLELCDRGADASITASIFEIGCLHWMHTFPTSTVDDVLSALLRAGGKPDHALADTGSIVNHHFPFTWPRGTALHWAVSASNQPLISALIRAGTDPCTRNGCDPYKSDENVRQTHRHGNEEVGEYAESPNHCLGLTAVDLAVAAHDWRSLHAISPLTGVQQFHLLSADEEGYAPFHRLSYHRVGRTVTGLRFWYPALKGDPHTRRDNLKKTIEWLQAQGGDIDQLTNTPQSPALSGVDGLTPLMIAVTKLDDEVVEALCEAGANVNLANRSGRTPLTLLKDESAYHNNPKETLPAIVACLVTHRANVNYRSPGELTPLQCLAGLGDVSTYRLLLEAGANFGGRFEGVETIAYLIFSNATYRLVLEQVSQQEVEEREVALSNVLHDFVIRGEPVFPNLVVDDSGSTLLHCCAAAGLPRCTAVLLDGGAASNIHRQAPLLGQRSIDSLSRGPFAIGTPVDVINLAIEKFPTTRSNRLSAGGKSCSIWTLEKRLTT